MIERGPSLTNKLHHGDIQRSTICIRLIRLPDLLVTTPDLQGPRLADLHCCTCYLWLQHALKSAASTEAQQKHNLGDTLGSRPDSEPSCAEQGSHTTTQSRFDANTLSVSREPAHMSLSSITISWL